MVLAAGPFGLGPMELVVILLVLVMVFGAQRLGDLGGSLGKGIKEFRNAVKDEDESVEPSPGPVTQGQGTVAATKCSKCGSLNAAGARFCSECGAAIAVPVS